MAQSTSARLVVKVISHPPPPRAVVFCAGEGTRLRPLTVERPKPMLPVGDAPVLDYILRWLAEQGVREVGINLHYRPEAIVRYVGRGERFGLRVAYSHERLLLGSAGALPGLLRQLGSSDAPIVAVYGDTLTTMPLGPLVELHRERDAALTMALIDHPNPTEAGVVDLVDRAKWHEGLAGRVARLVEKPAPDQVFSRIASAGVCVLDPSAVGFVPEGRPSDLAPDLIPALIAAGRVVAGWRIPPASASVDIGTWPSYRRMQAEWAPIWNARPWPH